MENKMQIVKETESYRFIKNDKGLYQLTDLDANQESYWGDVKHFPNIITSIDEDCGFDDSAYEWFYEYNEEDRLETERQQELQNIYESQGQAAARYYADN